jgi:hypothetical protein
MAMIATARSLNRSIKMMTQLKAIIGMEIIDSDEDDNSGEVDNDHDDVLAKAKKTYIRATEQVTHICI